MPDEQERIAEWRAEVRRRLEGARLSGGNEATVVEELSQHLEEIYGDLLTRGVSAQEARRLALAELEADEEIDRQLIDLRPDRSAPVPPQTERRESVSGSSRRRSVAEGS